MGVGAGGIFDVPEIEMVEKNSDMDAAFVVFGKKESGKLKFISGYKDRNDANALVVELDEEETKLKHGTEFGVIDRDAFFAARPELTPEHKRDAVFYAKYPELEPPPPPKKSEQEGDEG